MDHVPHQTDGDYAHRESEKFDSAAGMVSESDVFPETVHDETNDGMYVWVCVRMYLRTYVFFEKGGVKIILKYEKVSYVLNMIAT